MLNLFSPFTSLTVEPTRITPINTTANVAVDSVKMLGYAGVFILFAISIVFLIMFIIQKVRGSEKAKKSLIVFIVLISISIFTALGVVVLGSVWNTMSSI